MALLLTEEINNFSILAYLFSKTELLLQRCKVENPNSSINKVLEC